MGLIRAAAVTDLHVIVPEGIDDPTRPSGGNTYDRRLCDELATLGWSVRKHVAFDLPRQLARIPDGALVLLDGLVASPAPHVLLPEARRLRQVALVHMPLEDEREREVFEAASAVITTSVWARRRLEELYGLTRVDVAEPGVDPAALARGSADGGALLCVAAVTRGKGHDVLLGGLATLPDLSTRERFTLWPAVAMTIVMGMFPMVFLKPMEPAVARLV